MALHASPSPHLHLPLTSRFPPSPLHAIFKIQPLPLPLPLTLTLPSIGISPIPDRHSRRRRIPVASVVEESQESSESEEQEAAAVGESELASELKKAIQERKDKEGDNFWSGVAQEIREIEWPAFRKVLGTTGVVLSVILGSSVVLLTVNAVLAELSDRVFAGRGVQDFFT